MPNTPREGSCNRAPGCLALEQLCLRGHFVPIQVVKLQLPPPTEMGAGARCGRFSLPFSPFGSRGFPAHLSSTSDLALCLQHLNSDWPLRGRVTKDAMNLGTGSLGGPEPYPGESSVVGRQCPVLGEHLKGKTHSSVFLARSRCFYMSREDNESHSFANSLPHLQP